MRGNVVDMAVGIIIGASFGKIISSLVNDVLMPPLGFLMGKVDFSSLTITLQEKTAESAAVAIKYGVFINSVIDFIIVAFVVFIFIKQVNKLMLEKPTAEPQTKDCIYCGLTIPVKATRCGHCKSQL